MIIFLRNNEIKHSDWVKPVHWLLIANQNVLFQGSLAYTLKFVYDIRAGENPIDIFQRILSSSGFFCPFVYPQLIQLQS